MTSQDVNAILDHLRRLTYEQGRHDKARWEAITEAYEAIRAWEQAGRSGEIPYLAQLIDWGVPLPDMTDRREPAATPPAPTAPRPATPTVELTPDELGPDDDLPQEVVARSDDAPPTPANAPDPDDALQDEYDRALNYLVNENFHDAMEALGGLRQRAGGRLANDINRHFEAARLGLQEQVQPLIAEAQAYAAAQPDDMAGQRNRWQAVQVNDPTNVTVAAALSKLEASAEEEAVREQMADIRDKAAAAVAAQRLVDLERAFSRATSLRDRYSTNLRLAGELNAVIDDVEQERSKLRTDLGRPSTLLVSDVREAYRTVLEKRRANVAHLVDETNVAGQGAKAVVSAYELTERIRARFLTDLRDLVAQRQTTAAAQKLSNPDLALTTLNEALKRLEGDDILSADDQKELEELTRSVKAEKAAIQVLLDKYNLATEKVVKARKSDTPAKEAYDLLVAVQEEYSEYPGLEGHLETARDNIATAEARELVARMSDAKGLLAKEEFPAALALLKEARRVATTAVHHPKPGSPLALNLDALETLEQKIYDEQAGYLRLMQQLAEISTLMDQFEAHTAEARPLHEARAQMAGLSDSERDHPEARKRLVRLSQLQTVGDNWRQGQAAYHRGQWADAIELLKRVADQKQVKESPEAEKLMKRAEAARDILSAEKDEIAGNYAAALGNYKSAEETFVEYGDDLHTAELRAKALEGMARMARRTANNTEVETILAEAERNLVSLRTRVDDRQRQGLAAKVMPIADFKQLTETLSAALAIESTLKNEVEAKWSQARYDWLKAYRAGMNDALAATDLTILGQAKALGQELAENALLTEPEDRQLYRQLEEKWLDIDYARLRRAPTLDWAAIEQNRQRRLEISGEEPEIVQQVAEVAENRVLATLTQLGGGRRRRGAETPLAYLSNQFASNPALLNNQRLVAMLMDLLWQGQLWSRAETYARNLVNRNVPHARDWSRLWQGLNRGAQKLYERDDAGFLAEMERLDDTLSGHPAEAELRPIFEKQRDELIESEADKLVQEAQKRARQGSQDDLIGATSLYALVLRIDPTHAQAKANLAALQSQLQSIITNQAQYADDLLPAVPLKRSVAEGKTLLATLNDIQAVATKVDLADPTRRALNNAIDDLSRKVQAWDEMQKQLELVDSEVQRFKTEPTTINGDSGGWDGQRARRQLSAAQKRAQDSGLSDQQAIQTELRGRNNTLSTLDQTAAKLGVGARALLKAVQEEAFDKVDPLALQLGQTWAEARQQGFDGLDGALYQDDLFTTPPTPIKGLDAHVSRAERQNRNYDMWYQWAGRIDAAYKAVEDKAKFLKKELDDLRGDEPLEVIVAKCNDVLAKCDHFQATLQNEPRTPPQSGRALEQKARYMPAWNDAIQSPHDDDGLRPRAHKLMDKAANELVRLEPELARLDDIMHQLNNRRKPQPGGLFGRPQPPNAAVVRGWLTKAREQLAKCTAIDPRNPKVEAAKLQIEAIAREFQGR